jgi:N-acetylglucosaminyldiphosphoundecaprenol N-acetyl-beta-D-mannosaminyltransferase
MTISYAREPIGQPAVIPSPTEAWPLRTNILGVGVAVLTIPQALEQFDAWIAGGARQYVCVADVHAIMQSQWDPNFRKIHNGAGMVTPDGMPLVVLGKRAKIGPISRVYGPDLLIAACERSGARGYRHFFFGGAPGLADRLAERLHEQFPDLAICGVWSPPFRPTTETEDVEIAAAINSARPDFVWVGLSTPKQEYWMRKFRDRLDAPILLGIGAAFDFHAGSKPHAPVIIQRSGFEWLFRLLSEPKRLWPRYRRVIPGFLYRLAQQELGLVKFPIDD